METQPRPAGEPGTEAVRWGIGDAILGTVATLVVPLAVGVVVLVVTGREDFADNPLWATALLQIPLWAGLLGAPLYATMRKGWRSLAKDFGLRMRWSDIPLGIAVGLTAQFALGLVVTVFYDLVGIDADQVGKTAEALTDTATDAIGVVLLVLIVAVAAPVFEELFWRGLWLRSLERRYGGAVAVVASGMLFGAIHFQPYDFPALAGFGIVAAVLTMVTGRLGPAIWAHVAFNTTAVISLLLATQLGAR